jgi:hypothetical protein
MSRRRPVAGDEPFRGVVCLGRNPIGILGEPEVDFPQLRREVEAGGGGKPPGGGEDIVAPDELFVLVGDQKAAPAQLANRRCVLELDPFLLRNREQGGQRAAVQRRSLSGQCRGDERRIAFAVDEEERRSSNARQWLVRRRGFRAFGLHAHELRRDRRRPGLGIGLRRPWLVRLWQWRRHWLRRRLRLFFRAERHGDTPSLDSDAART